jgi:hypothetical protein
MKVTAVWTPTTKALGRQQAEGLIMVEAREV